VSVHPRPRQAGLIFPSWKWQLPLCVYSVVITVGGQKKGTNIRNLLINVFLIIHFVFQAQFPAAGLHIKSFTMSSFPQHVWIAEQENIKTDFISIFSWWKRSVISVNIKVLLLYLFNDALFENNKVIFFYGKKFLFSLQVYYVLNKLWNNTYPLAPAITPKSKIVETTVLYSRFTYRLRLSRMVCRLHYGLGGPLEDFFILCTCALYILHLTDSCPFSNQSICAHGLDFSRRFNLAGGLFFGQ
jgi:hypothetical protein